VILPEPSHKRKKIFVDMKWVSSLKCSHPETFLHHTGAVHYLSSNSVEKDYLSLFLDAKFYE
jgi:hypothetical protein